jgi:hypothetical protein
LSTFLCPQSLVCASYRLADLPSDLLHLAAPLASAGLSLMPAHACSCRRLSSDVASCLQQCFMCAGSMMSVKSRSGAAILSQRLHQSQLSAPPV